MLGFILVILGEPYVASSGDWDLKLLLFVILYSTPLATIPEIRFKNGNTPISTLFLFLIVRRMMKKENVRSEFASQI